MWAMPNPVRCAAALDPVHPDPVICTPTLLAYAQVWGELAKRWLHMRHYPGRKGMADCQLLPASLQRRGPCQEHRAAAGDETPSFPSFPRHGYVEGGKYYAVLNCSGNLLNVRFH